MSWASEAGRVELIARFTALPGREEEVARLLLALTAEVREEPGCLAFEPHRVAAAPAGSAASAGPEPIGTGFIVVEAYRDEAAFAAHLAAPLRRDLQRGARAADRGGRLGPHVPRRGSAEPGGGALRIDAGAVVV